MNELLERLPASRRRGSKPRCHWLTHGTREEVAARLSRLIAPHGFVNVTNHWMPNGFKQTEEAELHRRTALLPSEHSTAIRRWWLAICRGGQQKSPNFDIASTCTMRGADGRPQPGLLLLEAKAHDTELSDEKSGKRLTRSPSTGELINHAHIGLLHCQASLSLTRHTGLPWALSRDVCYQMSNRFAVAYKLTELGYAVALVYLGFLNANEMRDRGQPLATPEDWEKLVKTHSAPLFPAEVWNQTWLVNGRLFIPLIRSTTVGYDSPIVTDIEVS